MPDARNNVKDIENSSQTQLFKKQQQIYIDLSKDTNKNIAANTIKTYTEMYKKLNQLHAAHIAQKLNLDKKYFKQLEKLSTGTPLDVLTLGKSVQTYNAGLDRLGKNFGKNVVDTLNDSSTDLGTRIGKSFADCLSPIFNKLEQLLRSGMDRYMSAYESSFTEIASRTGAGYKGTRALYSAGIKTVYAQNASNVVSISGDMIPAMQQAAQQGFSGEKLINKAFNDSIAKYIMPWLQTTSDAFVNLSFNLSDYQMKSLKGQQLLLNENEGGKRLLQSGVVDSLLNDIAPLLTNIDLNTGGVANLSEDAQEIMLSYLDMGMSPQEAYSAVSQLINITKNPLAALQSGNVSKALASLTYTQTGSLYQAALQGPGRFAQMSSGMSGYEKYAFGTATGLTDIRGFEEGVNQLKINGKHLDSSVDALNKYLEMESGAKENITVEKRLTTAVENLVTPIAKIATAIPFASVLMATFGGMLQNRQLTGALKEFAGMSGKKIAMGGGLKALGGSITGAISAAAPVVIPLAIGALVTALGAWLIGPEGRQIFKDKIGGALKDLFGDIPNMLKDDSHSMTYNVTNLIVHIIGGIIKAPGKILQALREGTVELITKFFADEQYRAQIGQQFIDFFGAIWDYVKENTWVGKTMDNIVNKETTTQERIGGTTRILSKLSGISGGFDFMSVFDRFKQAGQYWKMAEQSISGSHAGGMSYVPYNGYIANLHEGERVLTKTENDAYTRAVTTNQSLAVEHNEQLIATVREVASAIISAIEGTGISGREAYDVSKQLIDQNVVSLSSNVLTNSKLTESR